MDSAAAKNVPRNKVAIFLRIFNNHTIERIAAGSVPASLHRPAGRRKMTHGGLFISLILPRYVSFLYPPGGYFAVEIFGAQELILLLNGNHTKSLLLRYVPTRGCGHKEAKRAFVYFAYFFFGNSFDVG